MPQGGALGQADQIGLYLHRARPCHSLTGADIDDAKFGYVQRSTSTFVHSLFDVHAPVKTPTLISVPMVAWVFLKNITLARVSARSESALYLFAVLFLALV